MSLDSGRTLAFLLYPTLANQKGTPVRLMQSRFLKELPDSRYEIHNAPPIGDLVGSDLTANQDGAGTAEGINIT